MEIQFQFSKTSTDVIMTIGSQFEWAMIVWGTYVGFLLFVGEWG